MTEFERQRIRRIIESTHGQPCLDSELDDIEQILSSHPDAEVDEMKLNYTDAARWMRDQIFPAGQGGEDKSGTK